jgi:hypothetical protein
MRLEPCPVLLHFLWDIQAKRIVMTILDEYRRNAQECERMAANAGNAEDKASWLRLAASWLGMISSKPSRLFATETQNGQSEELLDRAWPDFSEKDSKASH